METDQKAAGNVESLNIEQRKGGPKSEDHGVTSAHTIGHDSWQQVGLMLVTSFNCGYILSFSNLMLVPLGWRWGAVCLAVVGVYTAYANWLLAAFHFVNGKRFIRYRDVMGHVYGNMGFILLAGRALKEINSEMSNSPLRIQYFILVTGVAYWIFSFSIPTMSAMKVWLGISAILTSAYVLILLLVVVKDGKSNTDKNYDMRGSKADKIFNAFGAISAIIVCNTSGLLPEIQSTLRSPEKRNMRRALSLQYTAGLAIYYGVSIIGYWAYGSSVSWYLPQELSGPKSLKILINASVFLQSIISQHMFAAPIHETVDTMFLKLDKSINSKENIQRRLLLRGLFFAGNTFITAAFPFMGDFVNLFGSFTLVPLTFVFPSLLFIKVKGKSGSTSIAKNLWHWFNVIFFSLIAVATTVSALRLIANNIKTYSFFADPYI